MEEIILGNEYLVQDYGTSDGTQDKYYKDGKWYKLDKFGGEGYNEFLVSELLKCSNLDEKDYVTYYQVMINGKFGCYSDNFLKENEEYVSLYRMYKNITGEDILKRISNMEFDDQAEFIISFVEKEANINIEQMLGRLFYLDKIILNDDRHFNNIGLIFDGDKFRAAPIYDNGKSFFCGNKKYNHEKGIDENIKSVRFCPFTASIDMMIKRFSNDITFDFNKLNLFLEQLPSGIHKEVLTKRFRG